MNYPIFIKTENTLLSSLIKIDDLINYAIKNNITTLGIIDDNMYGVLEFYMKCMKNNIKPIIGLEVADVILYATTYNGYINLCKINTIKSKDDIDINVLKKYKDDLICVIPYENVNKYDEYNFYKYVFKGYENLDQKHKLTGDTIYFKRVYYLKKEDIEYLKYLYAIKSGILANDININTTNYIDEYKLYLNESNTKICDLCNVIIPLHQDLIPVYETLDNDSYLYLKKLVKDGLKRIFGSRVEKKYIDRAKYELDIINKMGFCNYFLIVYDYVKYAKEHDIMVGEGRGSASGSLVAYCLDITTIDPIKYDLLFERFLNPERISMPDIDIDFEYDKRDLVIEYCIKKYGVKNVAPIITFGTLGAKQVLRDVAKSMGINGIEKLLKLIDTKISLIENYNNNEIKKLLQDPTLKKLYKVSIKLEGIKRHTSIHAAGVIICNKNLDNILPLIWHDGFYITGYSMEYLEDLGLLKMDFLALRNLSLVSKVIKEANIDFKKIPLNDPKALDIFNTNTTGIFQFESSGMVKFLNKFKVTSFDDIVSAIALYRPGPMNNIDAFIKRKNNIESITYITPSIEPILKSTYGIIIYQEQIMQIACTVAGYSLAEADILRKAMSKKKEDILINEKDKFVNRSINNGYSKEVAISLYELILKFAEYGFNKAHSVAYAMLSYKMAYMKANYYTIFMKNLLSMVIGSDIKTNEYIKSISIPIEKPNINLSCSDYIIDNNKIIYPFTNIKNIGSIVSNYIVEERKKKKFEDIFDFFSRCYGKIVNESVINTLNKAGCFLSLLNEHTLDYNMETLINYSDIGSLLSDDLKPNIINVSEYNNIELLNREYEVLGLYLSGFPTIKYEKKDYIKLNELEKNYNKFIKCVVLIEKVKKVTTKNNEIMLFITATDEKSSATFVLFPKNYTEVLPKSIYFISGKVEKRFDSYQVVINELRRLE